MAYYTALITEWATLPSANTTAQKLAAINAMTVPGPTQDIAAASIEQIIVPTGELFALTQLANKTPSGSSPPTTEDQVIAAAWNFTQMVARWPVIGTSNPTIWAACQSVIAGLNAAGVLSASSVAAITALPVSIVLWWQNAGYTSPINANDLVAAGGLT